MSYWTSGGVTVNKQPWLGAEMGSSTAGLQVVLRINDYKVDIHINTEDDLDRLGCDDFCLKLKAVVARIREIVKGRPKFVPPWAGENREEP